MCKECAEIISNHLLPHFFKIFTMLYEIYLIDKFTFKKLLTKSITSIMLTPSSPDCTKFYLPWSSFHHQYLPPKFTQGTIHFACLKIFAKYTGLGSVLHDDVNNEKEGGGGGGGGGGG